MRLGLFGGSFDPIHRGHIVPVQQVRSQLGLDRVYYLPTARPPHKSERRFAPALARFVMVELALLDEPGLYVSPLEMLRTEPSYTVDSVAHFAAQWPQAELYVILGADAYAELDTWRRWRELAGAATLVVLTRPGSDVGSVRFELPSGARLVRFENEPLEVSSTRLREMLERGEEPSGEVWPPRVLDYIRKYALYS